MEESSHQEEPLENWTQGCLVEHLWHGFYGQTLFLGQNLLEEPWNWLISMELEEPFGQTFYGQTLLELIDLHWIEQNIQFEQDQYFHLPYAMIWKSWHCYREPPSYWSCWKPWLAAEQMGLENLTYDPSRSYLPQENSNHGSPEIFDRT